MKHITIDPMDPISVRKAVKDFEAYRKWVNERSDRLLRELAEEAAEVARVAFAGGRESSGIAVEVKSIGDGYSIEANGQSVVFLEFGTGAWTLTNELARNLPIEVAPGSWSRTEGKDTYDQWVAAGKPVDAYPYNSMPREGMYKAYKYILANLKRKAKEVFA